MCVCTSADALRQNTPYLKHDFTTSILPSAFVAFESWGFWKKAQEGRNVKTPYVAYAYMLAWPSRLCTPKCKHDLDIYTCDNACQFDNFQV